MILVWKDNQILARHDNDQDITALYPGAVFLSVSSTPNWGGPGVLAEDQTAQFASETGLLWNGVKWFLPPTELLKQERKRDRSPSADARVKRLLKDPAIRAIKNPAQAISYVNDNATNLAGMRGLMAELLFMSISLARKRFADDDTVFPGDE